MSRHIKKVSVSAATAFVAMALKAVAYADTPNQALETKSGSDLSKMLVGIVKSYAIPIGAAVIFIAVCITAFTIIINSHNAKNRVESMTSLLWIGIGAGILGLSLVITGVMMSAFGISQ